MGLFGKRGISKSDDLLLFKHFRLVKRIGEGNFSSVYQVQRLSDQRHYALKHIDIQSVEPAEFPDLVNEIRLMAALDHPNLMSYYEAWVDKSQLFIITNFASDGDLGTLLERLGRKRQRLPEEQVWSYFLQMALGVRWLHSNKVLHRDLKPHNILLAEGGLVMIGDLGISQMLDHVFERKLIGTPHYICPEMWQRRPYSFSADVWALGCILHEMCTRRPLFLPPGRPTDRDIKDRVLGGLSEPIPSSYSLELWGLIRRLLAPNPVARPTLDEVFQLPEVRARLHLLPEEVRPLADAAAPPPAKATVPGLFRISATPHKWAQLNAVLPPSRYTDGGRGVAASLIPRRNSCPDLSRPSAGACSSSAGGDPAAATGLSSLFRYSVAYPGSGCSSDGAGAAAARLRRASMGQQHPLGGHWWTSQQQPMAFRGMTAEAWDEGGGSALLEGASAGGQQVSWWEDPPGGRGDILTRAARLRRCKSLGDALRARRRAAQAEARACWCLDRSPLELGPPAPGGRAGPSASAGLPLSAGNLSALQAAMSAAYARPQQQPYSPAVSTIPQEPSDYATSSYAGSHAGSHAGDSYHGGSSYFGGGSHHGGSYHGGDSYHGGGSYHGSYDSSFHGVGSGSLHWLKDASGAGSSSGGGGSHRGGRKGGLRARLRRLFSGGGGGSGRSSLDGIEKEVSVRGGSVRGAAPLLAASAPRRVQLDAFGRPVD